MKNLFGAIAIAAAIGFMAPSQADAAPVADAAALAPLTQQGGDLLQQVHWRPYFHCHRYRWRRFCHGGRPHWRHRRHHHRRHRY